MTVSLSALGSALGLRRVLEPSGVLPQAAWRLDPGLSIAADEVLIRVDRLNLDAASYRQLREAHDGDQDKIRAAVLDIVATRGKMQNPVTGSGGMLTGTVEQVGPESPLGLIPGQRIATLVSLTLTPGVPVAKDSVRPSIDPDRFGSVVASDWGWWRTVTGSLKKLPDLLAAQPALVPPRPRYDALAQARQLLDVANTVPKGMKWKLRSNIGDKVRWYELPEEVDH